MGRVGGGVIVIVLLLFLNVLSNEIELFGCVSLIVMGEMGLLKVSVIVVGVEVMIVLLVGEEEMSWVWVSVRVGRRMSVMRVNIN